MILDDPRANEFIRLDFEIYVDQDHKEVKKFGDAMFDWVASLCDLIRYNHGDLDFTVIPSGSFPWNVKVENLDEFDYVSALENKAFAIEDKTNLYWPFDGHQISKTKLIGSALLDVLKLVLSKSVKNGNLLGIDLSKYKLFLVVFIESYAFGEYWSCNIDKNIYNNSRIF